MNTVLTIAGSDCSGGAGIQADIKTILANGAYAMSVITALTAQNTKGVFGVQEVDSELIGAQLEAVFSDIRPNAVKIGMIMGEAAIPVICEKLRAYQAEPIVVDPVMVSTSGARLTETRTLQCAKKELYPLAALITPNIPEAEVLSGISIQDHADMERAAEMIARAFGCAVLCKGGHQADTADDVLYSGGRSFWYRQKHIDNPNTHGTGCTLSSAAACGLAAGMQIPDAVGFAKEYVTNAILSGLDLGHGRGPLDHGYAMKSI